MVEKCLSNRKCHLPFKNYNCRGKPRYSYVHNVAFIGLALVAQRLEFHGVLWTKVAQFSVINSVTADLPAGSEGPGHLGAVVRREGNSAICAYNVFGSKPDKGCYGHATRGSFA